jgi:hypothetical protein
MNKLKLISLGIFLLTMVSNSVLSFAHPNAKVGNLSFFQIYDLSKKNYYEQIFTKDERKELKKAEKYYASAKKYMDSYLSDQKEIEKLYTIAEATSNEKSRGKSLKKARKLEDGAFKDGFKALDYYKKANDIKIKIYTNALSRIRLNDDSKNAKAGREFELQAKSLFESAKTKERTAPQNDDKLKFTALKEANNLNLKALDMQESAFGIYKNDPAVKTDIPANNNITNNNVKPNNNQIVNKDSVLFPKYVEQYNPLKDENLYQSKANMILPRLNLSNEEINSFSESNRKNQNANELLRQVDLAYNLVDSLNYVADRTQDDLLRDKIRSQAIEKENTAFYNLTKATNIYLDVNQIRYNIYENHFPLIDEKKRTTETEKAKRYEAESEDYYLKAKSEIATANKLVYKSDQYLKLMGANDLLLYALQLQESAYGIYFNMPGIISTEIDTDFVSANKVTNVTKPTKEENISNKLSWEVLATYTYSKDRPKPVTYSNKKGVVFLIQLGIYKGLLAPEKFENIQPIVFDKFVKNPYRRYMVGEYRTSEAADRALEKVKAFGYTDSYIISVIDGLRKSYSYGTSKINTADEHYSFLKRIELAKINGETINNQSSDVSNDVPKTGYVAENKIQKSSGLVYLVQLGMYLKPVTYKELADLSPVYTDNIPNKGTRYMLGIFNTIGKAREESQKATNKGIKDAFVIAYNNGEHISLDKAIKLEKQQKGYVNDNHVISSSNILFMVQVGAYHDALDNAEVSQLQKSFSPRNIDKQVSGGMNIYTIGRFVTYKDAEFLKKKLIDDGHNDVFVIAFDGTEKISVGEAIKKMKN